MISQNHIFAVFITGDFSKIIGKFMKSPVIFGKVHFLLGKTVYFEIPVEVFIFFHENRHVHYQPDDMTSGGDLDQMSVRLHIGSMSFINKY